MVFQIDTGTTCNILPFNVHAELTGDTAGANLEHSSARLVMHNQSVERARGMAHLKLERKGHTHKLVFVVVNYETVPLIGKRASEGMGLIQILDSDHIHAVKQTSMSVPDIELRDSILKKYKDVFTGIGKLEGEYSIQLQDDAAPVVHAPRKIPVPLRESLKEELSRLVTDGVLTPVSEPTPWVSSMVVARKKNGGVRICLDPKDLNKAIKRSHYPLPTIEEVATRLARAKVFMVLDAKSGFWHVKLDDPSSYLTTFNTPFGRYRWLRMPFGLNSAPEIWQRKMHEVVEGLEHTEVIADDFLVCGVGDTVQEAITDHDMRLEELLQRARECNLRLNPNKIQLRRQQVPFIGHLLTDKGLVADPEKVRAVVEMETPTDAKALMRFLGMVNYLAKFTPHLSHACELLRALTHQQVEWSWLHQHQRAFDEVKNAITKLPVLQYYDVQKEVTLQCDASQDGLGATLLQEGKPVAFASRALTNAECNYAQIEKELLAVVFAADKFEQYIYGRSATVESDHKPLEAIWKKPIQTAPKRLQRMLLRLQKYDLSIGYKRGEFMYIADTLSRAYLKPEQARSNGTAENMADHDHNQQEHEEFCHYIAEIDPTEDMPVARSCLEDIRRETAKDHDLQLLIQVISQGWPERQKATAVAVRPYFTLRNELSSKDGLVFKGDNVVVPASLRKAMLEKIHYAHLGAEGCLRRAREIFYWPRMSSEMMDYVAKCGTCNTFRPEQSKEPLKSHELPTRPWAKVATDIFMFDQREYLLTVDYYSNFWEVELLTSTTSRAVINKLRKLFSTHGIPETVVSDNGPQFASEEFSQFAKQWEFQHVTSSPHYPQSNSKVENAVRTCKRIMKTAKEAKTDVYLAILDFRNTPTEDTGTSPVQKLFARRTRTLLPLSDNQLQTATVLNAKPQLETARVKQAWYYDRGSKPLPELQSEEPICMRLPGAKTWTLGKVLYKVAPRSYRVQCGGIRYRRNRRQLRGTAETLPLEVPETPGSHHEGVQEADHKAGETVFHGPADPAVPAGPSAPAAPVMSVAPTAPAMPAAPTAPSAPATPASLTGQVVPSTPATPSVPENDTIAARVSRRGRQSRPPSRFNDFDMK